MFGRETGPERRTDKMRGSEEQKDALWLTFAAKGVGRIDCVDQTEVSSSAVVGGAGEEHPKRDARRRPFWAHSESLFGQLAIGVEGNECRC